MADDVATARFRRAVRSLESAVQGLSLSLATLPHSDGHDGPTKALRDVWTALQAAHDRNQERLGRITIESQLAAPGPTVADYRSFLQSGEPFGEIATPTPPPEVSE